ncbi:MAG: glycosyl transferase family 2 [Candidatus Eremiobacter antarcticus]|nr:glycosyltransferase [Candidatus Eremiobacteraeota bacterium]PZR60831.1 MAG: glycosyl transferase family 2 [Candidatus Eremiobacter sp. RRmetagenome_bin22]
MITQKTRVARAHEQVETPADVRVADVSIVIPVYNEARILQNLIEELQEHFDNYYFPYEILICENGSADASKEIGGTLARAYDNVELLTLDQPSYGAAIRNGILHSSSEYVFIFNADLWCLNFFSSALKRLKSGTDLVIGSKLMPGSVDNRPFLRRGITRSFNALLRTCYGFTGSDTHGLKAMRRSRIVPILEQCRTDREVFDTELVLRAQRAGLGISEVPVTVLDRRAPRMSLLRRVPSTIRDLVLIRKTL